MEQFISDLLYVTTVAIGAVVGVEITYGVLGMYDEAQKKIKSPKKLIITLKNC